MKDCKFYKIYRKLVCQTWKNTYSNLFDYSAENSNYEMSFVNIV